MGFYIFIGALVIMCILGLFAAVMALWQAEDYSREEDEHD